MLTEVSLGGRELRVGDYVSISGSVTLKSQITACQVAIAQGSDGPLPAVQLRCADGSMPVLLADQLVRAERNLRPLGNVTSRQRRDFEAAHAEGLHDGTPREFCPDCEADC